MNKVGQKAPAVLQTEIRPGFQQGAAPRDSPCPQRAFPETAGSGVNAEISPGRSGWAFCATPGICSEPGLGSKSVWWRGLGVTEKGLEQCWKDDVTKG